jgi:anti-sigma B factor antagonist
MTFAIRTLDDGVVIIALSGRLDLEWAQEADLKFSAAASQHSKVIIDLSEVTYVASLGIRTIVLSAKAVNSKGGAVVLAGPRSLVREVLITTGIDTVIPIADSVDEARTHLEG